MTNPHQQPVDPHAVQAQRQQMQRVQEKYQERLKERIIGVFSSDQGKLLLDDLEDFYLRQPGCPPGCPEGYGYFREGQNNLILLFRAILNAAQQSKQVLDEPAQG